MLSRPKGQRESLFLKGFDKAVEICDGRVPLGQLLLIVRSLAVQFVPQAFRFFQDSFHVAPGDQIGNGHLCMLCYLVEIPGNQAGLAIFQPPVGAGIDSEFHGELFLGQPQVFPNTADMVLENALVHAAKIRSNKGFYVSESGLTTMQNLHCLPTKTEKFSFYSTFYPQKVFVVCNIRSGNF